ncbi:LysR family transcriptional regulator [Microlunatus soli]|uniref:DNA-binding transcriptional regulator, LysR family n=1 Tax=Microlunatus soli TaxID=630515 RepID=A0A1H1Z4Y0_9ACTN|nr:LysR family transcriptional regulator [Microlunatus soli]SDT28669.1 DNA-binding transcriptional regulator, LysR family [Microlunatus soli]
MYSFEQLRGFVAVAEELHYGRAAERLAMTQPPLSRQIQKLERAIGVRLLERDRRRVRLTPAGAAFLDEARRLLALADAAPDLARRIDAGSSGTLRLGFTAASAYAVLPGVLTKLQQALPEVDLDLTELVTRAQLEALANHELDLGLARPPFDADLFASRPFAREALCAAVPDGHRLAALDRPLTERDLAGEPVIMPSATDARYFYDLVIRTVSIDPASVVHSVSQVLTTTLLVSGGLGIGFVPESVSRLGVRGVTLLELATSAHQPVELHLVWPRDSRNPALPRVIDLLLDRASGLPAIRTWR